MAANQDFAMVQLTKAHLDVAKKDDNGLINNPIFTVLTGDLLESSRRAAAERERRASTSTYQVDL